MHKVAADLTSMLGPEPGVGFAADAAGRYHCSLGVAVVTSLETPCRIFLKKFFKENYDRPWNILESLKR